MVDSSEGSPGLRVLLTKSIVDVHDRGIKNLARHLQMRGFEVIYITFRSIEQILNAAIQEDVEVIGLSSSIGGHMVILPELIKSLMEKGIDNMLLIAGGIISRDDARELEKMGVGRVFGPGTSNDQVVTYILQNVRRRKEC